MKLIVTGATGLVATEVIRQSLCHKNITQVVAVARKPVVLQGISESEAAKLKSVVIEDYEKYPDHARREFADADACIW